MDDRKFLDRVQETIRRHGLFSPGEKVAVGVSGGPDSVALLKVLLEMRGVLPLKLIVVHLDHGVRRGSADDARFVEALCRRWGVVCHVGRLPVRRSASRFPSEDRLRKARYAFFKMTCRRARCSKIALAHTQDDQAETVLMRILRGTGLYGLAAILPRRTWEGLQIVRPLIDVSKDEVFRYLRGRRLDFRRDPTNDQEVYLRNRVRRRLIPVLMREYNPRIRESLASLAATAAEDYLHLENEASRLLAKRLKVSRAGLCRMDLRGWERLDQSLRRMLLRGAVARAKGDLLRLELGHLEGVDRAIEGRSRPREIHLPGVVVRIRPHCAEIFKR